jgi:hypothetical protein
MLHACVERFDVMGGRENILGWEGEANKAYHRMLTKDLAAEIGYVWFTRLKVTVVTI